jgi:hypothetical protein
MASKTLVNKVCDTNGNVRFNYSDGSFTTTNCDYGCQNGRCLTRDAVTTPIEDSPSFDPDPKPVTETSRDCQGNMQRIFLSDGSKQTKDCSMDGKMCFNGDCHTVTDQGDLSSGDTDGAAKREAGINWLKVGGIAAGVIAIGVIGYYGYKKFKK